MRAPLTALYVPGDRPERFAKAVASGADIVILDLEDAVAPTAKDAARDAVVAWLTTRQAMAEPEVPLLQVRINPLVSLWGAADLAALPAGVAVRVPKVTSPEDVDAVLAAGGNRRVHALVESALGVEHAFSIAQHPAVVSLGLGEADLAAELGTASDDGLTWIRSRVVVAARAAGLPAPMMSVYPYIRDLAELAASCARGRTLGMRGRTAVHPRQVPVIAEAFGPTQQELEWARSVLGALKNSGVGVLPDGSMVDEAMARRARSLLS